MKKQFLLLVVLGFATQGAARSNILRPYDVNMRPNYWQKNEKKLSITSAFGFTQKSRNADGDKVSSPQYLHADQNALAMLKGMGSTTEAAALAQQINVNGDNGVRGHYVVTGDYQAPLNIVLAGHYHFWNEWTISAFVPFYQMKFDNVSWVNQTKNVTGDDALTRSLLTDNFFSKVSQLGDNLNLEDWKQTGIGDGTLMVSWVRKFFQNRPWLRQVNVNARAGISFPTGIKKDENKAFSLPFGNDGAYAIPFSAGLDLRFKDWCWAGVDISFEHIFSHTKDRRIMTDVSQTNYLFLQKSSTRKEYGFVQMFNLYVEPQITKALSVRCAYQHTKHGDDKLFVLSEDFSSITANKAAELEEWTTHNVFIQGKWDKEQSNPDALFKPQASVFAQIPFNGRRSLQTAAVGLSISLGF
ncbi:MAG: hypothetical protein ACJAZS_000341 [Alteromonas naphthalenivorans]|jgi:hypothetical protein